MHNGPLAKSPSQSLIWTPLRVGKPAQSTRALNPCSSWEGCLNPCSWTRGGYCGLRDNGSLFQKKMLQKNAELVPGKKPVPQKGRARSGTRHPHRATLSYFAVPACLIKMLFPLQRASVIIHSAFPPFASCCFPRRREHSPPKLSGCSLVLMETPWHKQVKHSWKAAFPVFFFFFLHVVESQNWVGRDL